MSLFTKLTATGLVLFAGVAPTAGAALPEKGVFLNSSHSNGVRVETTRHTVRTISFYCQDTRYDLVNRVNVRRDGSFSFHGKLTRYGPEGQPWGKYSGRFHGRFTSAKKVHIERSLPKCGTTTVAAKGKRS